MQSKGYDMFMFVIISLLRYIYIYIGVLLRYHVLNDA